jgi:hypothetical protein
MSSEPNNHERRNIGYKGTSGAVASRRAGMRRSLLAVACALVMASCSSNAQPDTAESAQVATSQLATDQAATDQAATDQAATDQAATSEAPAEVTTSLVAPTTVAPTTSPVAPTTSLASSTGVAPTTAAPTTAPSTTAVAATTTPPSSGTPRLTLSQTTGLNPSGTMITVRGSGFDTNKGVYVFVCNQAAWTASRRCIGGVNVDGSSPLSQWISSNPPGYAIGLTIPYESGGTFVVPLLVRAVDATTNLIDCSKERCGVVAFADHTRRDDRSQDVFVPITFTNP